MKPTCKKHLTSDEIIAAIVDANDLSAEARDHLASCAVCRREAETAGAEFIDLGEKAREFAPAILKPVSIAKEKQQIRFNRDWGLKPVLGFGFAVCLLAFVFRGGHLNETIQKTNVAATVNGSEFLFEEADRLVDNSMPVHYQKIIEGDAFREGDDMMDFIVPPMEETADFMESPAKLKEKEISNVETV